MKIKILILSLVSAIIVIACSAKSNWPNGMTPFFAECEGTQNVYTDNAWGKRKQSPCKGGWKFYDRGEPTLTN
jgi:hypothetical protein|tara:strand:+ start:53 stop:271 length:219 start_codon:yes stop_codon:yes gene_type:complete